MSAIEQLLSTAREELGYLEKASNALLEEKKANAGDKNYTKYGKAMGCNGQPWCDAFVDWCFVQTFGRAMAEKMLNGFSNYTPTSAQYYKNIGRWSDRPAVGDQVFFKNTQRICHTGIVVNVQDGKIFTIEGNTSDGSEVIANGGSVCAKSYSLSNAKIAGYGKPRYELVEDKKNMRYGIDVSDNQGSINWGAVKNSGVEFVILRTTRGSGNPDKYLPTNIKGCLENQIPFDFYKYSYALNVNQAAEEARKVLSVLKGYGVELNKEVTIWFDCEDKTQLALGRETILAIIKAFREVILESNCSFGLYMGKSAYESVIQPYDVLDPVWIARYPTSTERSLKQVPDEKYKPQARLGSELWGWQFSSHGRIAGITGNVDLDVAYYEAKAVEVAPQYYQTPEFTLIESLNKINVDSSFKNRKNIAIANGIENYTGTASQNVELLKMLREGILRKA